MLLSIGLAITVSPVVYKTIERVEMVLVVIIVAFLVVAIIIATDISAWTASSPRPLRVSLTSPGT